jgi:hypothetical protein
MPRKKPKFNKFNIPDSFLDTLYELTGSIDSHKGYVVCFIDEQGNGQVKSKFDSQATEFALLKFLEVYAQNNNDLQGLQYPEHFDESEEEDD